MKTCVILNPAAGRGAAGRARDELEQALRRAGVDYTLFTTHARGGAVELAAQASEQGFACVAAAGGDGTVNEVVNGILAARQAGTGDAALGLLPLGTGCDFAKMFPGFDTGGLPSMAYRLAAGRMTSVDLGAISVESGGLELRRVFINGLGAGIDAQVAVEVQNLPGLTGLAAYIVASLRALATYKPALMSVRYDGKELHKRLFFATVASGRWQGGGFLLTPAAKLDDELLDLCIVPKLRLDEVIRYYPRLFDGSHVALRQIITATVQQVEIASPAPFPVATDGEVLTTSARRVCVEVLPRAMRVVV